MNLFESIKLGSLIGKYLTGKESAKESEQLKAFLNKDELNKKSFENLKDKKQIASYIEKYDCFDKELAWNKYTIRLSTLSLKQSLLRWKVAAGIFLLIGISGIFAYLNVYDFNSITNKKLYTSITSPAGQSSRIVLPDNSIVWLNSETTLTYNNDYSIDNREIELSGQAYFQVERNEDIPLIVGCKDLNVRVLGTRFDVSAYPDNQQVNVVLESGSVELTHKKIKSFEHRIKPGEKAEFDLSSKQLAIDRVDIYRYTSWKDGVLIFKNDPMDRVIEKLERWYNIEIEVKDPAIYQLIFNATIINENVMETFDLIKFTCAVNYKIIRSKDPENQEKVILTKAN